VTSLAQAELYITLATVYSRFTFELYETDISDVEMSHGYLVPYPKWESKGSRLHPPYQNITKRSQGSIAENGISLEMLCDPLRNALGIPSTGVMLVYFIFPQQTKNTA
jgi:hypothetical protein